jgi:hypothetical protein
MINLSNNADRLDALGSEIDNIKMYIDEMATKIARDANNLGAYRKEHEAGGHRLAPITKEEIVDTLEEIFWNRLCDLEDECNATHRARGGNY